MSGEDGVAGDADLPVRAFAVGAEFVFDVDDQADARIGVNAVEVGSVAVAGEMERVGGPEEPDRGDVGVAVEVDGRQAGDGVGLQKVGDLDVQECSHHRFMLPEARPVPETRATRRARVRSKRRPVGEFTGRRFVCPAGCRVLRAGVGRSG